MLVSLSVKNKLLSLYFFSWCRRKCNAWIVFLMFPGIWNFPFMCWMWFLNFLWTMRRCRKMKWYKDISKAIFFSCVEERESYRKGGDKRGGSDKILQGNVLWGACFPWDPELRGTCTYVWINQIFLTQFLAQQANRHDCQVSMYSKYPCRNIIWATLNLYLNILKHFWAPLLCQIRKPIPVISGRSGLKHCQLKCHGHGWMKMKKQLVQSPLVSAL